MRLQAKYNKHENDCFNLLTVDPNPPHDLNHFSLILGLENTEIGEATQFARPTTFGLGHLAYCGALEIRAQSLFIVRSSSQGAL